jgi:hypothetical protein
MVTSNYLSERAVRLASALVMREVGSDDLYALIFEEK